ncbi:MAG: hypothetical protein PWP23_1375 [Candidatus Sumerlaeota bacterium]|nr:hypothetical protein [Candidatus Sumerlaeota bacterium]
MKQTKGFTLIELLIVVAIIAILAAIAVPNFLEAQTRSKVSRVKTDLRTLATGMEAYAIDNNRYPSLCAPNSTLAPRDGIVAGVSQLVNGPSVWNPGKPGVSSRFIWITTPVAYISSAFRDPFINANTGWALVLSTPDNPDSGTISGENSGYDGYDYVDAQSFMAGDILNRTAANEEGAARCSGAVWHIVSAGPDLINAFGGGGGNIKTPNTGCDYDPTNGTLSTGDIVRIGSGPGQIVRDLQPVYNRVNNTFNP